MTLRIALLGSPVSGSPSPAMHRAAAAEAGVDLVYEPIDVRLPDLARRLRELRRTHHGLNVTRPLKHAVLGLLDEVAPSARHAGSVNTVVLRGGTATGHSTDGPGFLAALRRAGVPASGHAVVLGAGGAARAVAWALRDAGARVTLVGRNEAPTRRVAEALGIDAAADLTVALDTADLLVNATPIGGEVPGDPLPPDTPLPPVVFDLVIRPVWTPLLRRAAAAGRAAIPGIDMLVEQGVRSFELWTGRTPDAEVMRAAALEALAPQPARSAP